MATPKFDKLVDVDRLALFKDKMDQANGAAFAPKGDFDTVKGKVEGLETTGGQPNVVESVKVNGTPLTPDASKAVDVSVPTTVAQLSDAADYARAADIPTDNQSLANGAGYQTASDVASAIAGKADSSALGTAAAANTEAAVADDAGLPTGAAVKSFVEGKGYQTAAQVASAVEGYGYQTATDVTGAINAALASAMDYKGTKAAVADLPATGNKKGDVWHVTADGSEYAWDGSEWQELGVTVSLSGYAQEADFSIASNAAISALFE